jgi:hypothetical protein
MSTRRPPAGRTLTVAYQLRIGREEGVLAKKLPSWVREVRDDHLNLGMRVTLNSLTKFPMGM